MRVFYSSIIFIADKEGDVATLERTKKGWYVNNKYPCRGDAIINLLETIKNVEVKMPVNKNARETVLKVMSTSALKVEIYVGDELQRQYYVGHETPDSEGSYLLLTDIESGENFKEPFVCFIPGFVGYLIPRFIAKEDEWRNHVAINYIPPQIKKITVKNNESVDSSFTIEVFNAKSFSLKDSKGAVLVFDEFKMKQYIAYFQNLSFESILNSGSKKIQDSLGKTMPYISITVNTNDFRNDEFKFYHKKPTSKVPEHGVDYKYDPDRLFMRFNSDKEWAMIQSFVFGKLLVNQTYFLPSSVKK